jgi:hypothetical protein
VDSDTRPAPRDLVRVARNRRRAALLTHTLAAAHTAPAATAAAAALPPAPAAPPLLCLGHHVEDAAETVMMRLLRGSSLPGLAGPRAATETFSGRPQFLTPLPTAAAAAAAAATATGSSPDAIAAYAAATEAAEAAADADPEAGLEITTPADAAAFTAAISAAAVPLAAVSVVRPLLGFSKARLRATLRDRVRKPADADVAAAAAAAQPQSQQQQQQHLRWDVDGRLLLFTEDSVGAFKASALAAATSTPTTAAGAAAIPAAGAGAAAASSSDDAAKITWVEDLSNRNEVFDRVRARTALFPSSLPPSVPVAAAAADQWQEKTKQEKEEEDPSAVWLAGTAALARRGAAFTAAVDALLRAHTVVVSPHGHVFIDGSALMAACKSAAISPLFDDEEAAAAVVAAEAAAKAQAQSAAMAADPDLIIVPPRPRYAAGAGPGDRGGPLISSALIDAVLSRVLAVTSVTVYPPSARSVAAVRAHFFGPTLDRVGGRWADEEAAVASVGAPGTGRARKQLLQQQQQSPTAEGTSAAKPAGTPAGVRLPKPPASEQEKLANVIAPDEPATAPKARLLHGCHISLWHEAETGNGGPIATPPTAAPSRSAASAAAAMGGAAAERAGLQAVRAGVLPAASGMPSHRPAARNTGGGHPAGFGKPPAPPALPVPRLGMGPLDSPTLLLVVRPMSASELRWADADDSVAASTSNYDFAGPCVATSTGVAGAGYEDDELWAADTDVAGDTRDTPLLKPRPTELPLTAFPVLSRGVALGRYLTTSTYFEAGAAPAAPALAADAVVSSAVVGALRIAAAGASEAVRTMKWVAQEPSNARVLRRTRAQARSEAIVKAGREKRGRDADAVSSSLNGNSGSGNGTALGNSRENRQRRGGGRDRRSRGPPQPSGAAVDVVDATLELRHARAIYEISQMARRGPGCVSVADTLLPSVDVLLAAPKMRVPGRGAAPGGIGLLKVVQRRNLLLANTTRPHPTWYMPPNSDRVAIGVKFLPLRAQSHMWWKI